MNSFKLLVMGVLLISSCNKKSDSSITPNSSSGLIEDMPNSISYKLDRLYITSSVSPKDFNKLPGDRNNDTFANAIITAISGKRKNAFSMEVSSTYKGVKETYKLPDAYLVENNRTIRVFYKAYYGDTNKEIIGSMVANNEIFLTFKTADGSTIDLHGKP